MEAPGICEEKKRLQDELLDAIACLNILYSSHIQAVIHDREGLLTAQVAAARQRKNDAKAALMAHLYDHGCGADGASQKAKREAKAGSAQPGDAS